MLRYQYSPSNEFGRRLKAARKSSGLTLQTVADSLNREFGTNVNKGTISKYENGIHEPNASTIYCLAQILGVNREYLLGQQEMATAMAAATTAPNRLIGYEVVDKSMAPRYLPQDILIVHPKYPSPDGQICLVEPADLGPIVRKVVIDKSGWRLESLNPDFSSHFIPYSTTQDTKTETQETETGKTDFTRLPPGLVFHGVVVELRRRELPDVEISTKYDYVLLRSE
jgi:transcriptional regulator with XRE-family HTH domain